MNEREKLKQDLLFLGLYAGNHLLTFRRMYSHEDLGAPINDIVDNMPSGKISWALQQVQNSLDKLRKV